MLVLEYAPPDYNIIMQAIILIAHNLRSTHNVGSLLRTAEGLGIQKMYMTGYTPHPKSNNDLRLPHLASKIHKQIQKTSLDADKTLDWEYVEDVELLISSLRYKGYTICGLEQDARSIPLHRFRPQGKIVLVVGREVNGLEVSLRQQCDHLLEIPMAGSKESFNVVQATAMALYQFIILSKYI